MGIGWRYCRKNKFVRGGAVGWLLFCGRFRIGEGGSPCFLVDEGKGGRRKVSANLGENEGRGRNASGCFHLIKGDGTQSCG